MPNLYNDCDYILIPAYSYGLDCLGFSFRLSFLLRRWTGVNDSPADITYGSYGILINVMSAIVFILRTVLMLLPSRYSNNNMLHKFLVQ